MKTAARVVQLIFSAQKNAGPIPSFGGNSRWKSALKWTGLNFKVSPAQPWRWKTKGNLNSKSRWRRPRPSLHSPTLMSLNCCYRGKEEKRQMDDGRERKIGQFQQRRSIYWSTERDTILRSKKTKCALHKGSESWWEQVSFRRKGGRKEKKEEKKEEYEHNIQKQSIHLKMREDMYRTRQKLNSEPPIFKIEKLFFFLLAFSLQ